MSLWFCQKCECTSDFEECEGCGGPADELLFIPRAELEELVGALEKATTDLGFLHHGVVTAAKFRTKYLEDAK